MVYSEELLQNAIHEGYFKSYNYSEFSVHKLIGKGGFGIVYKAKWKDCGLAIALKQLNIIPMDEKTIQRFVKELGWTDRLRMAREISDGLKFLHKNDIIHRDLHSKNILVHDGKLLIADFGLSKDETSKPSSASVHGVFGVILWEISSGRPPFKSINPYAIIIHVSQGNREIPIEGTPDSYIQLYERCWNHDPNQRPGLEEIQESLDLSGNENFGTSKFDEFISDTTPKILNLDIQLLTNSSHYYEKILEQLFKFIDNLFMEYFLNAGAGIWVLPYSAPGY
ncbi:kinase-like protein [Gigaspora margarita]|uniref:Kinase-like protein n=1 Tax=Gigaspora margarita TaxID=4874 RepID=A0A8H3X0N6_GIGMA|nr:kinase-like protein [Gigaspora margarita]